MVGFYIAKKRGNIMKIRGEYKNRRINQYYSYNIRKEIDEKIKQLKVIYGVV